MRTSLAISLLLLCFLSLFPKDLHSQDAIQYNKLYLHTDREVLWLFGIQGILFSCLYTGEYGY